MSPIGCVPLSDCCGNEKNSGGGGPTLGPRARRAAVRHRSLTLAAVWLFLCGVLGAELAGLDELDVAQAERLELLDENVEALGESSFGCTRPSRWPRHPGAALDVVALDGEELLERVRGAVRFHGPHLHLSETLTAELRLAAQRLLGDERVRGPIERACDLVVDEVVQPDVADPDGDLLVEGVSPCDRRRARSDQLVGEPADDSVFLIWLSCAPSKRGWRSGCRAP